MRVSFLAFDRLWFGSREPYTGFVLFDASAIAELGSRLDSLDEREIRVATLEVDVRPLDLLRSGSELFPFAGYFSTPTGQQIAGLGAAWQTVAPFGTERFADLGAEVRQLVGVSPDLRLLIGFSFSPDGAQRPEWDGFTPTSAVIPMISVLRERETTQLVVALSPGRAFGPVADALSSLEVPAVRLGSHAADHSIESRPSPTEYERIVAEAVTQIRDDSFRKAVMARSVVVASDITPRPFDLVDRLGDDYPACYVFGWQQGQAAFLGASPELLAAVDGRRVRSHPLAGSARRGEEEEQDRAIGEELMASAKNQVEHSVVVDEVASQLRPLVEELHVDAHPSLRKLTHVQHLSTEISGELVVPMSVVEVAGVLHPTPAVGGSPGPEALAFIDKFEGIDRGWYAGGIGWMSPDGTGEIAVALRCALVRDNQAFLYAGAGIVADSVPAAELEETRLKFRTMLQILTEA